MSMDNTKLEQIGELFGQSLIELVGRGFVRVGTVTSVDKSYAEVSLASNDTPIRVPLQVLKLSTALLRVVPKVDSTVAIQFIEGARNTPFFVALTEVEEYTIQVGKSVISMTEGQIEFNGGENGGLVLIEKLTEKLNQLKDEVSKLQNSFLSHTHATPAGLSDPPKVAPVVFSTFVAEDYENDKIAQ